MELAPEASVGCVHVLSPLYGAAVPLCLLAIAPHPTLRGAPTHSLVPAPLRNDKSGGPGHAAENLQ